MTSWQQAKVFSITFFTYAAFHGSRTVWSYVQTSMYEHNVYDDKFTGIINLCFLFIYGIFMKILGPMGGKWNLSYLVGFGAILAGISFGSIGLLGLFDITNKWVVLCFMILNGISQSVGWPSLVSIMSNWFHGANMGFIMGIWSGNQNFGDIIGLLAADIIVERLKISFYWAIIFASLFLFFVGILLISTISPSPASVYLSPLVEDVQFDQHSPVIKIPSIDDELSPTRPKFKLTFWNVWSLPGVTLYTVGFCCLKGTFLGFLFWLPNYFKRYPQLDKQASYIAQMFDYGTFIGGILIGFLGDKMGKRAIFICPSLVIASLLMISVKYALTTQVFLYYVVIFGMGVFQGGPYNNISGAIAIELSKTKQLEGNKRATSTVSSIIEGTGTLIAAFFQLVIPYIGQDQLFVLFTIVTGVAVVCTLFLMIKEINNSQRKQQK